MTNETAYVLNDNYQIIREGICVGLEHNQTEAKALANWLTYRSGTTHVVLRNSRSEVQSARAVRSEVFRHPLRNQSFKEMGII